MPIGAHGPGTAFAGVVTQEVINAVYKTQPTILNYLTWTRSQFANPQVAYLTSIDTQPSGNIPGDYCGSCQVVGELRSCVTLHPYGRVCYTSQPVKPLDHVLRLNQGEPDYELIGSLLSDETRELLARGVMPDESAILQHAVATAMCSVARAIAKTTSAWAWTGTGNGTEAFREFRGLELQISDQITDALTGAPCPALNSVVHDFDGDFKLVDDHGSVLARVLSQVMMVLHGRADLTGLTAPEFAIITSPQLKYLMAMYWPGLVEASAWYTPPTGMTGMLDVSLMNRRREAALASNRLVVNGTEYLFIGDPGVPESYNQQTGETATNIYVVPLRAAGMATTYVNWLDYSIGDFTKLAPYILTDGGRALWYIIQSGPCLQVSATMDLRVVLRAPQLAAKITNVRYSAELVPIPWPVESPGGGVNIRG